MKRDTTTLLTCQLPGCTKQFPANGPGRPRKYCCAYHTNKAWLLRNPDKCKPKRDTQTPVACALLGCPKTFFLNRYGAPRRHCSDRCWYRARRGLTLLPKPERPCAWPGCSKTFPVPLIERNPRQFCCHRHAKLACIARNPERHKANRRAEGARRRQRDPEKVREIVRRSMQKIRARRRAGVANGESPRG